MSFFERHQMRGISGKSSACAARQLKFGGWGRILDLRDIESFTLGVLNVCHDIAGVGRDLLHGDAQDDFIEVHSASIGMKC